MNYKITTLLVFTFLLMIVSYFMFQPDFKDAAMGWFLMGVGVPALVIWQVVSVLRADGPEPVEFEEGTYENY